MKLFLDTSSLFKIYHQEWDSAAVEDVIYQQAPTNIFLSVLARAEFLSAVWKKTRTKEIDEAQARIIIASFKSGCATYDFLPVDSTITNRAEALITKYRIEGLRTLDSIQLATCIALRNEVDLFLTSDNLLKSLLQKEGLPADLPEA